LRTRWCNVPDSILAVAAHRNPVVAHQRLGLAAVAALAAEESLQGFPGLFIQSWDGRLRRYRNRSLTHAWSGQLVNIHRPVLKVP
jgi:hypothetical protein